VRLIRHSLLKISAIMTLVILAATLASAQNATLQKISPQAGACATGPCVSTYHNDPMRDGVNSSETALKPSLFPSQSAANFGLLTPAAGGASGAVDGLIYAQPLYLSGVVMGAGCSGTQNIILVATENNSVYAFTWTYTLTSTGHTFSLTQCWMLNLNQPGEYAIPFTALPLVYKGVQCNTQVPQTGITGTPVVDTSVTPPVMYVVTAHQTANLTYTYRLHAININSGTEIVNGSAAPYNLSGVFADGLAANQVNQRPGLAMSTNFMSLSARIATSLPTAATSPDLPIPTPPAASLPSAPTGYSTRSPALTSRVAASGCPVRPPQSITAETSMWPSPTETGTAARNLARASCRSQPPLPAWPRLTTTLPTITRN
jgi:hypothetical protein